MVRTNAYLCRALAAVPLGLAQCLEKVDWDESASVWYRRVARLVPLWVVFARDYVEEVAFREAEFLGGLGVVVVECFDNLDFDTDQSLIITLGAHTTPQ